MTDINELTFEQAYEQLEALIAGLESGDLSLADSVAAYEQGRLLAARCQSLLDDAELRLNQLEDDGSLTAI